MSAPQLIGRPIKRREDLRFLTGKGRYVNDISLPGMLHAAFVRSPFPHAEVKAIGVDRARALPGVAGVMTAEESVRLARPIRADLPFPGWKGTDTPILGWPRVRFVGEAVAVVAAVSPAVAEDAAALVDVDYSPLPAVVDVERAAEPGGPLVREEWGDNLYFDRRAQYGDVEAAFAQADLVWERTYRTQRHTAYPLEGRACLADASRGDGTLTVYISTQLPHLVRTMLAECLGWPEHRLHLIAPDVGGGFGVKASLLPEEVAVCLLAIRLGRAVKWIEDSREHLLAAGHAREQVHHLQVAARRDGTILGIKADLLTDSGAYSGWPATAAMDVGMAASLIPGPYRIRNYAMRMRAVATNKCSQVSYRGVGRPSAAFSIERAIEDIARALGVDPIGIRIQNYVQDDEYPYTSVTGLVFDNASLVASARKAAELIDYQAFREEQRRLRDAGRYVGIGFGSYIEQTAHTTQEFVKRGAPIVFGYDSASVSLDPSGKAVVETSLHSHGQGHETTFAQVVAERLGLPIDDVVVRFGDTRSAPYGMGTLGSRGAVLGGGAAWKAADQVRATLLAVAAHIMEARVGDLEIEDGVIRVTGSPEKRMSVAEVTRLAYHRPERLPPGILPAQLTSVQSYDAPPGTGTWSNSIHAAVVEVDVRTGRVQILRYLVVEDCGNMINPLIVDGQVHGGTAQGIGSAMLEHLVYDEHGVLLTQTLLDYLLPTALDVPMIDVHHLCTPSPTTLGGFKGVGEGGAIAPLPALANAVVDALAPFGVAFDDLPLSPARVFARLREANT